jgi:hypothetical protein
MPYFSRCSAFEGAGIVHPSTAAALLLTITLTTAVPLAPAREVGGIDMPEQASASAGGAALRLNGAGVRRKLFVAVYAVGLYLPAPTRDPAQILAMDGPRLVAMRFLHREVPRDKLVAAWNEGFAANQDPATLATLQARIDRFNALFETLRQGDTVELAFDPAQKTTRVSINGTSRGEVPGADFAAALLRIWLGPSPVSDDLKAALLGP